MCPPIPLKWLRQPFIQFTNGLEKLRGEAPVGDEVVLAQVSVAERGLRAGQLCFDALPRGIDVLRRHLAVQNDRAIASLDEQSGLHSPSR